MMYCSSGFLVVSYRTKIVIFDWVRRTCGVSIMVRISQRPCKSFSARNVSGSSDNVYMHPLSSPLSLFAHVFNQKRGVPTLILLDGGGATVLIGQRLQVHNHYYGSLDPV